MIRFADYAPDQPDFAFNAAPVIKNVIPSASGHRPFPAWSELTAALSAEPKGSYFNIENDGTVTIFAGTVTKLYKLDTSDNTWEDVTNTGGDYTGNAADGWVFTQFGSKVIATNGVDNAQVFDVGTDTDFSDLGGTPPLAKRCTTVGDYVVLYGLIDNPERVHWSGTNNATQWTIGERNSGYQDFPNGGEVQFVAPIERNAIILQKTKSRAMIYEPANYPFLWSFREIDDRGAVSHRACTTNGSSVFFLAEDGFFTMSPGGGSAPIGAERVDLTFRDETSSMTNFELVHAANDPVNKLIVWAYSTTGVNLDAALAYSWEQNKWVDVDTVAFTFIIQGAAAGVTLEQLANDYSSIEDVPVSLDSGRWVGGKPLFAAFDSSFKLGFFDGSNLEATVETSDIPMAEGRRTRVRAFRPVTDASSVMGRVGTKETYQGAITWSSEVGVSTRTGRAVVNKTGFTHRYRCRVPAGETWDGIMGIESVESTQLGSR